MATLAQGRTSPPRRSFVSMRSLRQGEFREFADSADLPTGRVGIGSRSSKARRQDFAVSHPRRYADVCGILASVFFLVKAGNTY